MSRISDIYESKELADRDICRGDTVRTTFRTERHEGEVTAITRGVAGPKVVFRDSSTGHEIRAPPSQVETVSKRGTEGEVDAAEPGTSSFWGRSPQYLGVNQFGEIGAKEERQVEE